MKFELVTGQHHDKGINHVAGAIIESSIDLSSAFLNKFNRRKDLEVAGAPVAGAASVSGNSKPAVVEQDVRNSDEDAKPASVLGEDVSEQFQSAKDADLRVFLTAKGKYNVSHPEQVDTAINKGLLRDKKAVESFIADYIA